MRRTSIVTALLACAGCSAEIVDPNAQEQHVAADEHVASGAVCPLGSTLTYERFGRQFVNDYCLRCHSQSVAEPDRGGAPIDINLDQLSEIRAVSDHIDRQAAAGPDHVNEHMPPDDPKPSPAERQMLGEWLACGAP